MVADAPTRVVTAGLLVLGLAGCGEGGSLAVSAGAPVTAAVRGQVTQCGYAVANAEVMLLLQQHTEEQARPVDTRLGPRTTGRDGGFFFVVSPSFAVPGRADMQLTVTAAGVTHEIPGGALELHLGTPPRDTARLDVDLSAERGTC
jgi:hypothetical protein